MSDQAVEKGQAPNIYPRLKLLFLIIDWDKNKIISDVFEKEHTGFVFISKAMGTATSEILDILGIGSTDKALVFCLAEGRVMPSLITAVRRKLGSRSAGAGIAFTVPLAGINALIMRLFMDALAAASLEGAAQDGAHGAKKELTEGSMDEKNDEDKKIEIRSNAVISIMNHGYSEEFMTAAREAGARGGTVISARGLSSQKSRKFLGISIQDEKEIILVLADKDKSLDIMQAVGASFGQDSPAKGIIFSLPVDRVMSLNDIS